MALPTNREEFKQYCLRRLGHPVIEINLSDEQIDDRIDEAISFFRDYHYDGSQLIYLKHQLTQEDIDRGYIETPKRLLGITRIFDIGSSISVTITATAYNTSSDYRLKEKISKINDASGQLMKLKPVSFEFKIDPGSKVQGFIAHEVAKVIPNAVTGKKDDPEEYQSLDHSKLVPLLTGALQESIGEVRSLRKELDELKALVKTLL